MKRLLLGLLVLCSVAVAQTGVVSVERSGVPFFATIAPGQGAIFNIEGKNTGTVSFTGRVWCTIWDVTTGTREEASTSDVQLYIVKDSQETLCENEGRLCYFPSKEGTQLNPGDKITGKLKVVLGSGCSTSKRFELECAMDYRTLQGVWMAVPNSGSSETVEVAPPDAKTWIELAQIVFFIGGSGLLIYGLTRVM